eukprot:600537-Heterocapsa_arctica.AAC.1
MPTQDHSLRVGRALMVTGLDSTLLTHSSCLVGPAVVVAQPGTSLRGGEERIPRREDVLVQETGGSTEGA